MGIVSALIGLLRGSGFRGVNTTTLGDTVIYRASPWWIAIILVPATAFLVIGVVVATMPGLLSRVLGGMAFLAGLIIIAISPTVLIGELVVTSEQFSHTVGFWWNPKTTTIRFDDVQSIQVIPVEQQRGPPTFNLECRRRDGDVVTIPKSTAIEAGLPVIFVNAARRGVELPGMVRIDEGN